MKERYRVSFEVDGECSWEVEATSPEEARADGIARFQNDRFWAQKHPNTPACTVQRLSEPDSPHDDVGPFY
jgi:hypothetical protein